MFDKAAMTLYLHIYTTTNLPKKIMLSKGKIK